MKTKPFLLATAGATVDGRTIDAAMIQQMADSYKPATYTARLNIEHVRGISPGGAFGAYGDVLELSTAEVDVDFNGQTEKRLGLFGIFEVTEDAKALNDAGQKLYPSVEIHPNFADKGFAYLMGVALTDSPASIATDRLAFNRSLPGALALKADKPDQAFALEFADQADPAASPAADSFLGKLGGLLDGFAAKFGGGTQAPAPAAPAPASDPAFDFAALRPLLAEMGENFNSALTALRTEAAAQADQVALQIKAIETRLEGKPAEGYAARPAATGGNGDRAKTDC